MKWQGRRGSRNIEDRRHAKRGKAGSIGGLGLIAILVIGYLLGVDVTPLLQDTGGGFATEQSAEITPADEKAAQFVSVTLADTEEVWADIFAEQVGRRYNPPTLVLFKGSTQSACGGASASTGPFYCPPERKAYLDTSFFATLDRQLGARGDFAAAYVIAHEVAHHVQNELGILGKVEQARRQSSQTEANALTVRLELQADCLSGVWARSVEGLLEPGDMEEALNAARMIGDDRLQKRAGRVPQPHTFTHGTSAQRARWFTKGFQSGDINVCDTFGARTL